MVASVERVHDISTTEEEELEASETRQPHGDQAVESSGHGRYGNVPSEPRRSPRVPTSRDDIETMTTLDLLHFATGFVRRMREQNVRWLTSRMLAVYGECPDDAALFPWWFANILPVREMEKYRLLGSMSVRERLKICCVWILEWEASRW
jgi:hypothetical protein